MLQMEYVLIIHLEDGLLMDDEKETYLILNVKHLVLQRVKI